MKGKILVPLILASVSATTLATSNFSVKADYAAEANLLGDLISISGLQGNGKIGEEITLPNASVQKGSEVKITVLDPRGKTVTLSGNAFTPTTKGYYTVKYTATKDNTLVTATEELKILVEGEEYSISLPKNSEYVIPATVKTNSEIKIPLPTVYEGDKELSVNDLVKPDDANNGLKIIVVSKDNPSNQDYLTFDETTKTYSYTPQTAGVYQIIYRYYNSGSVQNYKTDSFVAKDNYDISDMELSFSYKTSKPTQATLGVETILPEIKVFDKNGTTDELDAYVKITVNHVAADGTKTEIPVEDYAFTPTLKGNYQVTYQASIPLFNKTSKTSTFIIEDVKDTQKPTVLPVNQYTTEVVDGKTVIATVYKDLDKDGTYTDGTDLMLYNKNDHADKDEQEKKELIDMALGLAKYDIPSIVALTGSGADAKATVKIPAIYGYDNYDDLKDIKFVRSVRRTSTGIIEEIKKTSGSDKVPYANNEWAEYTFTSAGDYTIRYIATDKSGNETISSFDITVVASDADLKGENSELVEPTIDFPAVTSSVESDGKIVFSSPVFKDNLDTRVQGNVYYSFSKDSYDTKNEVIKINSDGKFVLNLKDITVPENTETIYLHAVAKNDYNPKVTTAVRAISIINKKDNVKPIFISNDNTILTNIAIANREQLNNYLPEGKTIDANGQIDGQIAVTTNGMLYGTTRAAFSQKDVVKLPEIRISDKDPYLTINVKVRDPYGKIVTVKNTTDDVELQADTRIHKINGGTFVADYSGVYSISYTAKDSGGNLITKSFGIRVFDTEKPTINLSSYDPFSNTVEVGKFIEIPAATLKDNGVLITDLTTTIPYESIDFSVDANKKAGTYWTLSGPSTNRRGTIGFTPDVAGDYMVTYYGWDKEGNLTESKTYTIVAKDTIKPTIELENDYILYDSIDWKDEYDGKGVEVIAPGIGTIFDGYKDKEDSSNDYIQTPVSEISLVVKVTDADGNNIKNEAVEQPKTLGSTETTTRYKFIAERQGVYTITYIATDAAGNSIEHQISVKVGDCDAPDVEWENSKDDLISTAKLNAYYDFNLDMLKIDDKKGTEAIKIPEGSDKAEYTITVNMYDPSSSVVTNLYKDNNNNTYRWKFEESGTYELRIVATDKAGNKTTKSYNIVVSSEKTNSNTVKPIVGTILIVISALIVVGVIAYFVISGRKKGTKKGSKTNKK